MATFRQINLRKPEPRAERARAALLLASGMLSISVVACDGQPFEPGFDQPIRISGAVLQSGQLPSGDSPAEVSGFDFSATIIQRGQSGVPIAGRTSPDTYSIGLQLSDFGTGYWTLPVQGIDPTAGGKRVFTFDLDLAHNVEKGRQPLRFVAFDESGRAGAQRSVDICVLPEINDNLNACDPSLQPPALGVSIRWRNDADVDLVVIRPDGNAMSASALPIDPGVRFSGDSNPSCNSDNRLVEWFTWNDLPEPGAYLLYADLYELCGERSTRVITSRWDRRDNGDGTYDLEETVISEHVLQPVHISGGAGVRTWLGAIVIP